MKLSLLLLLLVAASLLLEATAVSYIHVCSSLHKDSIYLCPSLLLHEQIGSGATDCLRRATESTVYGHAHVQIVSLMRQFWNFVICMNMHNVICLSSLNNLLSSLPTLTAGQIQSWSRSLQVKVQIQVNLNLNLNLNLHQ